MLAQTVKIDRAGRVTLPQPALDVLRDQTSDESEVVVELTDEGVILKPKRVETPITARIAAMNLPVADWTQMEQDIEGRDLYLHRRIVGQV